MGVETCPFIFELSGPLSWRKDINDIMEWSNQGPWLVWASMQSNGIPFK